MFSIKKMFFASALSLILAVAGLAQIPGSGFLIEELSDDFEDSTWVFNYDGYVGTSSNGKWRGGSSRGTPELLARLAPPAGGIAAQSGALRVQTYDTTSTPDPNPPVLNQEDLLTQYHNTLLGRYLIPSDRPSFVAHIYLPPYSTLLKTYTPGGSDEYSTLGFRIEARSDEIDGSRYYPSIWLQYYDYGGSNSNNFGVVVRMGDGQADDVYIKNMGSDYPGGWVKVGIGFDEYGTGHYYFKEGVSEFTAADKIYDTTMFPDGSNAKMDWIAYNFISIGYPSGDPDLSADYRIEDVSVYTGCPESWSLKSDFNGDCKIDFKDLIILSNDWLKSAI